MNKFEAKTSKTLKIIPFFCNEMNVKNYLENNYLNITFKFWEKNWKKIFWKDKFIWEKSFYKTKSQVMNKFEVKISETLKLIFFFFEFNVRNYLKK
jgi:hypothetical protein